MQETSNVREAPVPAPSVTADDPVIVETCPTCISGIDATVTAPEFAEALSEGL
jgi:hypothetical protein